MATFRYSVTAENAEEHVESGTVVASDKETAKRKLQKLRFHKIHLKKVPGIKGLIMSFSADVR